MKKIKPAIIAGLIGLLLLTAAFGPLQGCATRRVSLDLPEVEQLAVIEKLPDPFLMHDGSRVRTKADWAKRREEIKQIILHYQYGSMPPGPKNITAEELSSREVYDGAAIEKRVILSMGLNKAIKINVGLIIPNRAQPMPVILRGDRELGIIPIAEEIVKRGYIVAEFIRHDLDNDNADRTDGVHPLYPDYDWATLSAWAWGYHRVVDYLMTLPCVDKHRIAITGHSRGGKTALLAGALDERIALVAPNGSGCGGAGCYRFQGKKAEDLAAITQMDRFHYWFVERLRTFIGHEKQLPFDQHFVKALVAPRALLSTEALGDLWANPYGTQQSHLGAKPVYDFLGAGDRIGIYFRDGGHAHNAHDFRALLDFADKQFFGKEVERKFDNLPFPNAEKPYSWTIPKP